MNILDIGIIGVLGYNAFQGFRKGLIKLVFDMVAMGVGILAAMQNSSTLAQQLHVGLTIPQVYASIIAFALIWVVLFFSISLIGRLVTKIAHLTIFGPVDKFGGVFFGCIKGLMMALPIVLPLIYFDVGPAKDSVILTPLKPHLHAAIDRYVPAELLDPKKASGYLRKKMRRGSGAPSKKGESFIQKRANALMKSRGVDPEQLRKRMADRQIDGKPIQEAGGLPDELKGLEKYMDPDLVEKLRGSQEDSR